MTDQYRIFGIFVFGLLLMPVLAGSPSMAQHSGPPGPELIPDGRSGRSADPVPGSPSTGMTPEGPVAVPGIEPTPGIGRRGSEMPPGSPQAQPEAGRTTESQQDLDSGSERPDADSHRR